MWITYYSRHDLNKYYTALGRLTTVYCVNMEAAFYNVKFVKIEDFACDTAVHGSISLKRRYIQLTDNLKT